MMRTLPSVRALGYSLPRRPRLRLPRRWIRKTARRIALASGLALCAYLLLCLFMIYYEPQLVYLPARPSEEWLDKPSAAIEDITLRTKDGALHGWYLPVKKSDAVVLMCHGQSGNLTARGQGLPDFAKRFNTSMLVFD